MMALFEFDFEPFNADKRVSSLDKFLSYMSEKDIFDSFPGIRKIIASDVVCAMSYLHTRDIVRKNINPANALVSNFHYKSYKHVELEMGFGKKPIVCKLGNLGEARSMYTQTNALTGKNCTTAVHGEASHSWSQN